MTYGQLKKNISENLTWLKMRSDEIDRTGRLPDDVLAWLIEHGLFKLFVPKALGGHALTLEEALRLVMLVAEADGSVAWQVQIGSGGGYFVPSFTPSVAEAIFSPQHAVIAGSGYVGGFAYPVPGGYRVSGYWRYASGAQYATTFTANAFLLEGIPDVEVRILKLKEVFSAIRRDDVALRGDAVLNTSKSVREGNFTSFHALLRELQEEMQGQTAIRAFAFTREAVETFSDWQGVGMRGTSSEAMIVRDVFVPQERSFVVGDTISTLYAEPLIRVPFVSFAEASIGAVVIGLAQALAEEISRLLTEKTLSGEEVHRHAALQDAVSSARHMKLIFLQSVRELWEQFVIVPSAHETAKAWNVRGDETSGKDTIPGSGGAEKSNATGYIGSGAEESSGRGYVGRGAEKNGGGSDYIARDDDFGREDTLNSREDAEQVVGMFSWTVRHAVRTLRQKAWEVFPYLGMRALDERSRLNRIMRDMETAAHHVMLL
ncbi:MAG: hypothetical protein BSOLF_1753 [Candidatus Carbobacillus altaicus]|uniref:Acyl-CoA dehydrogenase/oxidase N-terminal domain-containing protein n=1 Tax=Candidatus Carbonibacillus altaicus TaxID=2163959 RepID=A0A2R6XYZ4_9BACL|nr:MAG: hypothetical protein BSOLF_1753 [Candidatus Carbobacillus altaicus]